jgi:hypothetical protein
MAEIMRSADKLAQILIEEPGKIDSIKKDPKQAYKLAERAVKATGLPDIPPSPVYKIVVVALGLVAVLSVIGSITLVFVSKSTPEAVVALGSASIGALAGLLMPISK